MAKKAKRPAQKPKKKSTTAVLATAMLAEGKAHPDKRLPLLDSDTQEVLCKWNTDDNQYVCKIVPIGGDW
jgi:hypothetical protein